MKSNSPVVKNVDEYIASFPKATQKLLHQLRKTIRKAAPQAEEVISYQMPAYNFYGRLVYFAGYEKHIGFYPMPSAIEQFKGQLADYITSKGTVQFPLDRPLPVPLITKMTAFRVKENLQAAEVKGKLKPKTKKPK